jgi:hypothetical protein
LTGFLHQRISGEASERDLKIVKNPGSNHGHEADYIFSDSEIVGKFEKQAM